MFAKHLAAVAALAAACLIAAPSLAQAPKPNTAPASFTVISPVFSQLVAFSMPSNFVAGYEDTKGGTYTREAIPKGESVQRWTEMITVTGAKGLAANTTAEKFAGTIAGGFQRACPDSFAATGSASKLGGLDAFVAVVGCGKVGGGADVRSETALLVAIKGAADIYTLQWAERGAPSGQPDVENARWQERLKQLGPIRVCAIMPGEKAPYPSCVGKP